MDPDGATLPTRAAAHPGPRACRAGGRAGAALAAAGAAACALGAAFACLRRVEVVGGSMAPALLEGDRLLVAAPPWGPRIAPGDVVALPDPRRPARTLVKRVAAVDRTAGTVEVLGDAAGASTDSRTFGPVPLASVDGRAVFRYGPPGRTGPLVRPRGYDRP